MLSNRKVRIFGSKTLFMSINVIIGLDCTNRVFISDRAHLVFDFHQIVDGLKEVELGKMKFVRSSLISP